MKQVIMMIILVRCALGLNNVCCGLDNVVPRVDTTNCPEWNIKTIIDDFLPISYLPLAAGWVMDSSFSDEFNGISLNQSKWEILDWCHPMSKFAKFSNDTSNVKVASNKLYLKVKQLQDSVYCETWDSTMNKWFHYSSGWVASKNLFHYGYVEIKCRLPQELAMFPCFWLEGEYWENNIVATRKDEIDVFECLHDNVQDSILRQNLVHNMEIDGMTAQVQRINLGRSFVNQDIIFAVEWLPMEINFYINGRISGSSKPVPNNNNNWINKDLNKTKPSSDFTCTNIFNPFGPDSTLAQKLLISLSLAAIPTNLQDGFDIDYVKSYKLLPGDTGLYWPSTFDPSDPNLFKVHESLKLGGPDHTAIVEEATNVSLWATESIILDAGFTVQPDTPFTARRITTHPHLFNDYSDNNGQNDE